MIFRAKRKDTGEWIKGYSWKGLNNIYITPQNAEAKYNKNTCHMNVPAYEIDPKTIGQYIGLEDDEGKRIYEGDIVEVIFSKGYVHNRGYFIAIYDNMAEKFTLKGYNVNSYFKTWDYSCKVIGNIYDHIELLG